MREEAELNCARGAARVRQGHERVERRVSLVAPRVPKGDKHSLQKQKRFVAGAKNGARPRVSTTIHYKVSMILRLATANENRIPRASSRLSSRILCALRVFAVNSGQRLHR
ncbi:MAG: hypothetical protein DMG10_02655 [Acidobacteria bacterium]|nr:MAG: hypothetical protein DMG10_02655 [Acidobacteriota bacterium]